MPLWYFPNVKYLGATNPVPSSFFYAVMPAHLAGTAPVRRWGKRARKEEVEEAQGSWVEGGLLTHSSVLALPRAAPRGAQPTHNPHNPRSPALSQRSGQGKQTTEAWDSPATPPKSMLSFWSRRDAPPFRASPPGGKLPVQTGRSLLHPRGRLRCNLNPATRNSPPAVSPSPSIPPPQPSTDTYDGLRPTQDLGVPLPDPEKGPPTTPHRHTHTPSGSSLSDPVEAAASTSSGRDPGLKRGGVSSLPETPSASLPTRSGGFSFPGMGGRRSAGGEGEDEEPRSGRNQTGTTSTGPTLGPAQSTPALPIGQT